MACHFTHTISARDSVILCASYGYKQPVAAAPTAAWLMRQNQVASGSIFDTPSFTSSFWHCHPSPSSATTWASLTPRFSCATQRRLLPCLDRLIVVSICSQRWNSSNLATGHNCQMSISTKFFFSPLLQLCRTFVFLCWEEPVSLFSLIYIIYTLVYMLFWNNVLLPMAIVWVSWLVAVIRVRPMASSLEAHPALLSWQVCRPLN